MSVCDADPLIITILTFALNARSEALLLVSFNAAKIFPFQFPVTIHSGFPSSSSWILEIVPDEYWVVSLGGNVCADVKTKEAELANIVKRAVAKIEENNTFFYIQNSRITYISFYKEIY